MNKKILVTYASRTGWTVGVAETIGKALVENGAAVDVIAMRDVQDLSAYDAIVAGSAVRDRQWLPEAVEFIRLHQGELRRKPFAAFLVCMTLAMKNGGQYRPQVAEWLAPIHALANPVSVGLFAGGLDINRIESLKDRLMFRISVLFGVWKEGDHRDWNAIRTWAGQLKPLLTK